MCLSALLSCFRGGESGKKSRKYTPPANYSPTPTIIRPDVAAWCAAEREQPVATRPVAARPAAAQPVAVRRPVATRAPIPTFVAPVVPGPYTGSLTAPVRKPIPSAAPSSGFSSVNSVLDAYLVPRTPVATPPTSVRAVPAPYTGSLMAPARKPVPSSASSSGYYSVNSVLDAYLEPRTPVASPSSSGQNSVSSSILRKPLPSSAPDSGFNSVSSGSSAIDPWTVPRKAVATPVASCYNSVSSAYSAYVPPLSPMATITNTERGYGKAQNPYKPMKKLRFA
ncbi:hypothetical protein MRB53_039827 [Persea americana]|nr:hypothetical protein MRB53_039827 [Persea americana]